MWRLAKIQQKSKTKKGVESTECDDCNQGAQGRSSRNDMNPKKKKKSVEKKTENLTSQLNFGEFCAEVQKWRQNKVATSPLSKSANKPK